MRTVTRGRRGLLLTALLLGWGTAAATQPPPPPPPPDDPRAVVSRGELLRRVDRATLAKKHHIDTRLLESVNLGMLLSIDGIEPSAPVAGGELRVAFTLTNLTRRQARGTTIGQFQGKPLVNVDGSSPTAIDLAPGLSLEGVLRSKSPLLAGGGLVQLLYRDGVNCWQKPGPHGQPLEVCVAEVSAEASANVSIAPAPTADTDYDGVPDAFETRLLSRFRPYYRFSVDGDDEDSHPADAEWFVRRSELMDHHSETDTPVFTKDQLSVSPSLILNALSIGPSRIAGRPGPSGYRLNLSNEFRSGEPDWKRIKDEGTGLYGHVAPLHEDMADLAKITAYKIEYWQFYAFNPVPGQIECSTVSDAHEGDWEGVELVVAATPDLSIRSVRHNVHSTDVVFVIAATVGLPISSGPGFREHLGPGASIVDGFDLYVNRDREARHNGRLRLFCDEDGCTHPVVYIEHGGHASWPTEYSTWPVVAKHGGDSPHAYLVAPPVNLGEVGHPNPSCAACALVLGFNGHWGACGSDPPHGPPLKDSWGKP